LKYNFDEIIDRKGTNSVKWEFIAVGDESQRSEMLPLSIADMDFACAPEILDALKARVDRRIFGYTLPYEENYLNSVVSWFDRRFDWKFQPEQIVTSPGIVPALAILVKMFSEVGNGVIIQTPVYYPFSQLIKANGRQLEENELICIDGKYSMDFDDLEKKAKDPNNKIMFLCSPHNPVGRVWTEEELTRLLEICLENDVHVISDEIHCDIVRSGVTHVPLAKISNDERIITCTAASKSFNLAGLQLSNVIFNNTDLRERWDAEIIGKTALFGSSSFGITATQAAYDSCEYWIEDLNGYIDQNLEYIKTFLDENMPQAKYHVPEGTYFAWIDLRSYGLNAEELERKMVYDAKLVLDEGYIFGESGSGFERLNVACPREILAESLQRMCRAIQE